tara:strand:- start:460 stop:654 length:195 start_codon:yes stop_codon:yes gene_type:complete
LSVLVVVLAPSIVMLEVVVNLMSIYQPHILVRVESSYKEAAVAAEKAAGQIPVQGLEAVAVLGH